MIKKIVFYSSPAFFDATFPLLKALVGRGIEVHYVLEVSVGKSQGSLFDIQLGVMDNEFLDATSSITDHFPEEICHTLQSFSSFKLLVYNNPKIWKLSTWVNSVRFSKFIKKINPDIIHTDTSSIRFTLSALLTRKYPLIMSVHDATPHRGENNWRIDVARKMIYPNVDKFILHNQFQISDFLTKYPLAKGKVVHNKLGIYEEYNNYANVCNKGKDKTVLFFGRLSQYKGLDVFIQAAHLTATRNNDIEFIIAGQSINNYDLPPLPKLPQVTARSSEKSKTTDCRSGFSRECPSKMLQKPFNLTISRSGTCQCRIKHDIVSGYNPLFGGKKDDIGHNMPIFGRYLLLLWAVSLARPRDCIMNLRRKRYLGGRLKKEKRSISIVDRISGFDGKNKKKKIEL